MPGEINTTHGQNFMNKEITDALLKWYPDVDESTINDIASEYSVDFQDVLEIYQAIKIEKDKEHFEELKTDVKNCLKEYFNQFSSTSVNNKLPLFSDFYQKFSRLYSEENYKEEDVKKAFIELTEDPNQTSLFEIRKKIRNIIMEFKIEKTKK